MKYFVVSDIHGFYTPLQEALQSAGYFDCSEKKLLILGDLFDRGQEAVRLQEFILEGMADNQVLLIRGNHEDLYSQLVTEDAGIAYDMHIHNGTYSTALQLTGYDRIMAQIRHYDFAEKAKETPYFQEIIPAMKNYLETEHYIFVHGWIPCSISRSKYDYVSNWREANDEDWMAARWINGMDAAADGVTEDQKTIVCGHWHTSYGHSHYEQRGGEFTPDADFSPYCAPGIMAIDGCTAYTGKVNCIVIEDEPI